MSKLIVKAFCDGSGNSPRGSTCAAVLFDLSGQVLLEKAIVLEICSNNIAEYSGVILAIQCALDLEVDELSIFSDSQLIVNQINEKFDCKDVDLRILREIVWDLAGSFKSISIEWVPREQNKRADHLCRICLDAHSPKKNGKVTKAKSTKRQRSR